MFPANIGSPNRAQAGDFSLPQAEKRQRSSSSDDEQKNLEHPSKLTSSTNPALAKQLRGKLAGNAAIPLLIAEYDVGERIFDNDTSKHTPVYRVSTSGGGVPLVAKIVGDSPEGSPVRGEQRDPFRHSVQQYMRIGAHPNLNRVHGIGAIHVGGVEQQAMIMDAGDMSLHRAIGALEQARVDGTLSDASYFGVVLPCLARSLLAGAAHCAAAQVAHRDLTSVNVLMFKNGGLPQLADLGNSTNQTEAARSHWPQAEVDAGNPFVDMYPTDSRAIARILLEAAAPVTDGGAGLDGTTTPSSPALHLLQRLVASAAPDSARQRVPQVDEFDFLKLGNDEQATTILHTCLKDVDTSRRAPGSTPEA